MRGVHLDAARHGAAQASPPPDEPLPARLLTKLPWQGKRPQIFRLVRAAVVTPWFAVSVGIVVATTLTLTRPHPALTFPPGITGRCVRARCASPPTSPSAPGPAINHGVILPRPGPRRDANVRLAGVTVEYGLLSSHGNRFMAVILIVSRHSLGGWQLRFSLPGGKIDDIMWAKWQSDGRDGVIVMGSPAPWSADASSAKETRIIVIGTGTPAWPVGCRFDGASCRFRHIRVGGRRPGHGQRARVTVGGQES